MANQDSAFGLRPLKTVGQQDDSTGMTQYNILPGDASLMYQGSLVIGVAAGYVDIAAAASTANLGAFWGCFYDDPTTQKPVNSGAIECFVYDSPYQMFEIMSDNAGASAQADIFATADITNATAGSTLNGVSGQTLGDGSLGTAAAQLKIIGVSRDPKNSDLAYANVNWRVMINEHLLGSGVGGV
jgi:hypothetical protein